MPSASTKLEITASSEALVPVVKVLNVIDKKVRNLEKRKSKLDLIKDKLDQGNELEKDQQVAISHYEEVIQNLDFARELQKQFQAIHSDAEKLIKKQAKRGKSDKQQQEVKRVSEILKLQGLMDNFGSENVRADFKSGKHGAIVLTEENLEQIDELYKLISPSRDGELEYTEAMSVAADHIVCLTDARDKPVVGSTYKELKELLDLIAACGYFEKAQGKAEVPEESPGGGGGEAEFELVEHHDVPSPDSEEVQASLPPEVIEEEEVEQPIPVNVVESPLLDPALNTQPQVTNVAAEADSFFSTPVSTQHTIEQQQQQQQQQAAVAAAAAFNRQRPFQEIVSSVQGSFNFLQESTIEVEAKREREREREFSPHMDPAVVAAHPMPQPQSLPRPSSTQTPEVAPGHSQPSFGKASSYVDQRFADQDTDLNGTSRTSASSHSASVDQNFSQANTVQSQDFKSAGYSQNNLTHTLQTDTLFSGAVTAADTAPVSHSVMGQGPSDSGISQFEIPPQIPMPPGHDQTSQEGDHQSQGEKKGYHMNPNASEFQSLIYPQGEEQADDKSTEDSANFQGTTFTNSSFQQQSRGGDQRGGDRGGRGGFNRGRSNRGGGGGGGGNYMSNGFSRGGGGGGNRDNRGGGGGYDRSNSGGSGGGYQNYPQQRNDYRGGQEGGGYQGNNSFNNGGGGGFQKRGGGNFARGGTRGAPRGGSGNANFNRGAPRGGFGGRGGNNQGFGRPNFNQQQTTQ